MIEARVIYVAVISIFPKISRTVAKTYSSVSFLFNFTLNMYEELLIVIGLPVEECITIKEMKVAFIIVRTIFILRPERSTDRTSVGNVNNQTILTIIPDISIQRKIKDIDTHDNSSHIKYGPTDIQTALESPQYFNIS